MATGRFRNFRCGGRFSVLTIRVSDDRWVFMNVTRVQGAEVSPKARDLEIQARRNAFIATSSEQYADVDQDDVDALLDEARKAR